MLTKTGDALFCERKHIDVRAFIVLNTRTSSKPSIGPENVGSCQAQQASAGAAGRCAQAGAKSVAKKEQPAKSVGQ